MTHIIIFEAATGAIVQSGNVPEDAVSKQGGDGQIVLKMDASTLTRSVIDGNTMLGVDQAALKTTAREYVDSQAGAFRSLFITDVPGQAQTYEKKEAEARLWTTGDEAAHPDRYPFMITEATVRSVSVATVQGEIMAQVNALIPLAALVEGHRIAAKTAVSVAIDTPGIIAAMQVDWQSLLP